MRYNSRKSVGDQPSNRRASRFTNNLHLPLLTFPAQFQLAVFSLCRRLKDCCLRLTEWPRAFLTLDLLAVAMAVPTLPTPGATVQIALHAAYRMWTTYE